MKKIVSAALILLLIASVFTNQSFALSAPDKGALSVPAQGEGVAYIDYDEESGSMVQKVAWDYEVAAGDAEIPRSGWVVVNGDVNAYDMSVEGETNLILCDGATLTLSKGIRVERGNSLTIYGQSEGTGRLTVKMEHMAFAGIGHDGSGGAITVNGGNITVTGDDDSCNGVCIGGPDAAVTINGGAVTAAGRGSNVTGIRGDPITVRGGTVRASGSDVYDFFDMGRGISGVLNVGFSKPGDFLWAYSYDDEIKITATTALSDEYNNYAAGTEINRYDVMDMTLRVPNIWLVTFDPNGGGGAMANVGVTRQEGGAVYTLPACGFTAPEGQVFKTWEVDGGWEIPAGEVIGVTWDTAVKALWETPAVQSGTPVSYRDENGRTKTASAVPLTAGMTSLTGGWYAVTENTAINTRVTVKGDVKLILCDGKALTASMGVNVSEGNSLTVYGQSGGTGRLTSTAVMHERGGDGGDAGIGGGIGEDCGTVTVVGGVIEATGGAVETDTEPIQGGAGIGGGSSSSGLGEAGEGGTITILGGTVTATGHGMAAGIGGGASFLGRGGDGGTILISGGTVTASDGGDGGPGIGGGFQGAGGSITISGGTVNATGSFGGAGIGGNVHNTSRADDGSCGVVTITGGTVNAAGGYYGAGIGGSSGTVIISGGTVTAVGNGFSERGDTFAGAGIGNSTFWRGAGAGLDITITGGTVTAIGNEYAAGIGDVYNGGASTVTLGYGSVTDRMSVTADSYLAAVKLEKPFADEEKNMTFSGEIDDPAVLAETTLTPANILLDPEIRNGTVTADSYRAAPGQIVTLSAAPDSGCTLSAWRVTGSGGRALGVVNNKFVMPFGVVTVSAVFSPPPFGPASFTLPAALRTIEESAFEGDLSVTAVDARYCTSVGANAFKGSGLTQLKLSKDCAIDATAFTDCGRVYVYAPAGGTTESACAEIENCVFVPHSGHSAFPR